MGGSGRGWGARALDWAYAVPAIEVVGYDAFCREIQEVIEPLAAPTTGVRIPSELGWITAEPS